MNEIGTHHVGDGANGILGNSILMTSVNPTEMQSLVPSSTMVMKELGRENPIVGVDSPNSDTNISGFALEQKLATQCIKGIEGVLHSL